MTEVRFSHSRQSHSDVFILLIFFGKLTYGLHFDNDALTRERYLNWLKSEILLIMGERLLILQKSIYLSNMQHSRLAGI